MKKIAIPAARRGADRRSIIVSLIILVGAAAIFTGCSDVQREPGRVYMPDMGYSRAYETYAITEEQKAALLAKGIHYSNTPVPGTIKRGELLPFLIVKDKSGDTTNYAASKQVRNPLTTVDTVEAERLYLVNCGICHGPKLDGNGPLYRGGDGPFPVAPAQLVGKAQYENMPEGQMFYSVTYGKNKMGSYASQLNTKQRWMVIAYIKSKQTAGKAAAAPGSGTGAGNQSGAGGPAVKDSTAKK
jgi:mono/diheme cytochrome c family protein